MPARPGGLSLGRFLKQDVMEHGEAKSQTNAHPFSVVGTPSNYDLDIGVIYTYEDHFMSQLLTSLVESGAGLNLRLVLIDNASEKGVSAWNDIFPATSVVRNTQRLTYLAS